jgi:hypothetical protein
MLISTASPGKSGGTELTLVFCFELMLAPEDSYVSESARGIIIYTTMFAHNYQRIAN